MHITDLTHLMTDEMPVFPGSDPVVIKGHATIGSHGYNEIKMNISGHTGTHIDCGRHIIDGSFHTGTTPPEKFAGKGMVIDCRDQRSVITESFLTIYYNRIKDAEFVLLHSGCDHHWGKAEYFREFPVLTPQAALYLTKFNLKGVGIDAPSFDPATSSDLVNHHLLLGAGLVLIENLCHLSELHEDYFLFCCFPLKIENGDGSPVRAVGITGHST